jgi:hypothetical protein
MRTPRFCVLLFAALLVAPGSAAAVETVNVALELTENGNNYDDPCFWQDPTDAGAALACMTSKDDDHVECFALPSGTFVGLATGFSGAANNCEVDQARNEMVTTDNGGDRVLVHRMPDIGGPVRVLEDSDFSDVTGVCVAHKDGKSLIFVTDESRKKVYALDSLTGQRITSFSHGLSKAEGIACDDGLQRVYVCDDQVDDHGCQAFTFDGTPVGPEFGISQTKTDSEGVTVYECGPTEGYIIVSDQSENEFEVFDRQPPFTHRCTFEMRSGSDITDDTDGIDVVQIPAYPNGLFGACDGCSGSTDELDLAYWEDIAAACGLRICPLGEAPGAEGPICGDGTVNQPTEMCDRNDDAACPGRCAVDCTCIPADPGAVCGDNVVNQSSETCDGVDDAFCPGACQSDCTCPLAGGVPASATVVADASTMATSADTNYNDDELSVDAGSAKHTFLKIRVDGVGGRLVTQALIHMRVHTSSNADSDHGGRFHETSCAWDEGSITWNTEPSIDPLVIDEQPKDVSTGDVVTFDLTGYLDRDGEHCFAMTNPSTDSVRYSSRETGNGPIVEVMVAGTPAPGAPTCGDGIVNQVSETCDGGDDTACPGACQNDCSCPTGGGFVIASVVEDAAVRRSPGGRNYNDGSLIADRRSPKQSFFRIRVSGVGGRHISRALLQLQVEDSRRAKSNHGGLLQLASCDWTEDTLTWDTKPEIVPNVIATHDARVAPGERVTFDLTDHIPGDGEYCFCLGSPSANAVRYASRETTQGPVVDVTLGGTPTPRTPACGDNVVNRSAEECDGLDDGACPGLCLGDCTCEVTPASPTTPRCGDGVVNQGSEACDGGDDAGCPGQCLSSCSCPAAPPRPAPAPNPDGDTFACLAQGADITLRGVHESQYSNRDMNSNIIVDATEATFIHCSQPDPNAPCNKNIYPITLGPPNSTNACWAGGVVDGANRLSASWSEMHDPNNAGFAFENPNFTLDGVRIHNTGDGIRPRGGAQDFLIKDVWLSHIRDDCVENDHMERGLVDDSLFDGCFVGFSSRNSSPQPYGPENVVTIQNTLVRLESMPFPPDGGSSGHKGFFKVQSWGNPDSQSPQFALYNNIFMAEEKGDDPDERMGLPPGKIAGCANNIMVWLGSGDYPADLPDCFTVVKDRSVWDNARADWIARHPEIPSLGQ